MAILTIISFPKKMSLKERFKSTEIIISRMLSGRPCSIGQEQRQHITDNRIQA